MLSAFVFVVWVGWVNACILYSFFIFFSFLFIRSLSFVLGSGAHLFFK